MQDLKAKFDAYYNSHLLHKFAELEEERQKQLTVFIRRLLRSEERRVGKEC